MKQIILLSLLMVFTINFSGCDNQSNLEATYEKKNETFSLDTEPKSYRKYALVSSANIEVKKTLSTDGPLADVHANGEVKARSLSLDISGKITSSNNLDGSIVRSFDYDSPLNSNMFVKIRALKVDEYLNTNDLNDYYLLSNKGEAIHKIKNEDVKSIDNENIKFVFKNNTWTMKGEDINLNHTLVVQGNLKIESNYTFIAGTLMVQGDLNASGELNINTGTPFEKALIVDKNIEVDKLVAIGRVHGSGIFTAKGEVNILGNAEIDGNITLWGNAKINFLDNVYKSALYEAQQEANENNTTMMLAHSQLFSNVKGKNSVVLFTFVEGNYILNEDIINKLIDTNQTDDFQFKSYLYGATIDYGSQLQKFDGLSPYFQNKHKIIKKLLSQGYENIKISESLDIAPSNLYHTFTDKNNNTIGTYQVYSLSNAFDENNLTILTQTQRDDAIYTIDHKDEIDTNQEAEAKEKQEKQKQSIINNDDLNLTTKSEMLNEIEASENNETAINKEEVKKEATQDRVQEWVEYKDLASEKQVIDAQEITVATTQTRGWWKKIRRAVKRVFKVVTFTDCHKRKSSDTISHVNNSTNFWSYRYDDWSTKISIHNDIDYCTPTAIAMILNYNYHIRKGKKTLYNSYTYSSTNPLSKQMADEFHTSKTNGTSWWRYFWEVPYDTTRKIWKLGMYGYSYTWYTAFWNRDKQYNRTKWYIKRDNPIMFNAMEGTKISAYGKVDEGHSMPVIGYKNYYYKGSCWKKIVPQKKWLLVDTEFRRRGYDQNQRGYIRFDSRANYFRAGTITYVKVW
jgi:cytoskeletal protein CcmA (bactofilin family)